LLRRTGHLIIKHMCVVARCTCLSYSMIGILIQRNRLAWPHPRRGLASDGVRYAGARSSVGPRFQSATKLRLEWYGGVFLLLQQRSKHPREMVIMPKAATSLFIIIQRMCSEALSHSSPSSHGQASCSSTHYDRVAHSLTRDFTKDV